MKPNDSKVILLFKQRLLRVLDFFDKFCTENGLQYFASGGTAIGAVRHGGIIPWDDDIDVVMPRKDFDELVYLRSKLSETNYGLKVIGDDGYLYAFGKFYDKNTTLVEVEQFPSCVVGVNIDIFPLDTVSDVFSNTENKRFIYERLYTKYMYSFHAFTWHSVCAHIYHLKFKELWYIIMYNFLESRTKINSMRQKFIEFDRSWREDTGSYYYNHAAFYPLKKELLKKEWFEDYIYVPFNNTKIRLMKGNNEYLTQLFGDYMTPPPENKRIMHHYRYYLNLVEGLDERAVLDRIKNGEYCKY